MNETLEKLDKLCQRWESEYNYKLKDGYSVEDLEMFHDCIEEIHEFIWNETP